MSSELFSSIQTIRNYLKGKDTNSISLFRRPDISFSSVPSGLASRLRTAWKGSQKSWEEARHEKSEKFRQLSLTEKKLRAAAVSQRIRERALYKSNRKHLFSFKKYCLRLCPMKRLWNIITSVGPKVGLQRRGNYKHTNLSSFYYWAVCLISLDKYIHEWLKKLYCWPNNIKI